MLELKVHSLASQEGKMEIKWVQQKKKKLESINVIWSPQKNETRVISYYFWPGWCGCLKKSGCFIKALYTHTWPRIQRSWRKFQRKKVEKLQLWLLPHIHEVNQQVCSTLYKLQNVCSVTSTTHIAYKALSCCPPYLETYRKESSEKCSTT